MYKDVANSQSQLGLKEDYQYHMTHIITIWYAIKEKPVH